MPLLSKKEGNHLGSLVEVAILQDGTLQKQMARLGLDSQQQQCYLKKVAALPYQNTKEKQYFINLLMAFHRGTSSIYLEEDILPILLDVVTAKINGSFFANSETFWCNFYDALLEELNELHRLFSHVDTYNFNRIIREYFHLSQQGRANSIHFFKRCLAELQRISSTPLFVKLFQLWIRLCWKNKRHKDIPRSQKGHRYFEELWKLLLDIEQRSRYPEGLSAWLIAHLMNNVSNGKFIDLTPLQNISEFDNMVELVRQKHPCFDLVLISRVIGMALLKEIPWVEEFGFARYITYLPSFLIENHTHFLHRQYQDELSEQATRHLMEGRNIRTFGLLSHILPLPFNKRAAHIFHTAIPKGYSLREALLYATLSTFDLINRFTFDMIFLYLKEDRYYCNVHRKSYPIPNDIEYIASIIFFFRKFDTDMDEREKECILQFFIYQKNMDGQFVLKGRNPQSIFKLMSRTDFKTEHWSWKPFPIKDFYITLEGVEYRIIQLTTPLELKQEGIAMHHCVGSYVSRCYQGDDAIWSLQEKQDDIWDRKVTVHINKARKIVQAKMFANRTPKPKYRKVIHLWKSHILKA